MQWTLSASLDQKYERILLALVPHDYPALVADADQALRHDAWRAAQAKLETCQDAAAVPERLAHLDRQLRAAERAATSAKLQLDDLRDRPGAALADLEAARRAREAAEAALAEVQRQHAEHGAALRRSVGAAWRAADAWGRAEVTATLKAQCDAAEAQAFAQVQAALAGAKAALANLAIAKLQQRNVAQVAAAMCSQTRQDYLLGLFTEGELRTMQEEDLAYRDPTTGRVLQPSQAGPAEPWLPRKLGY